MTERDDLDAELEALGQLQRERLAARVDAWDRVAAGERSVEDVRHERLAAGDAPEQVELGAELFRPFDEADDHALAEALVASLRESEPETEPETETEAESQAGGNLVPLRRRPWLALAVLLAAAAVLLIWVWPRPDAPEQLVALDTTYTIELGGGVERVRGDEPSDPHVLAPETPFEWILTPAQDITGPIVVELFAYPPEGPGRRLDLQVRPDEVSDYGTIRLTGTGARLGLEPGMWTIVVAIAREGANLPDVATARPPSEPQGWQRVDFNLQIIE